METRLAQGWDVVWDYTMGLPEQNGFDIFIDSVVSIEETENGIKIIPSSSGYVRYIPKNYELCNEGIFEVNLYIKSLSTVNGFRMILSNGAENSAGDNIEALQIYTNASIRNSVKYQNVFNNTNIISDITLNTEYIFRIERRNGVNFVYLNGEKIKESTDSLSEYAGGNRIFFQSGGEYLLKSIKFKKIS